MAASKLVWGFMLAATLGACGGEPAANDATDQAAADAPAAGREAGSVVAPLTVAAAQADTAILGLDIGG
jgi:ABC-type uncharacterized transport system auxiliary subunit